METCDLLEKWRDGVKNDLVHLSEKGPWGEGFVIYGICRYVLLSVIWCRNQIREVRSRIRYHFPGN